MLISISMLVPVLLLRPACSRRCRDPKVKMHMLPAPFSPLLVLTSQLPSRTREAIPATIFTNALLPVLDGTNLADGKAMQLPTGAAELPYLLYLVWFTPWVAATMMAVALFMLPYCVVSFAITQAVRLTRRAHLRQQTLRTRRREERRRSAMDDDGSTGNVLKSPATRRKVRHPQRIHTHTTQDDWRFLPYLCRIILTRASIHRSDSGPAYGGSCQNASAHVQGAYCHYL